MAERLRTIKLPELIRPDFDKEEGKALSSNLMPNTNGQNKQLHAIQHEYSSRQLIMKNHDLIISNIIYSKS